MERMNVSYLSNGFCAKIFCGTRRAPGKAKALQSGKLEKGKPCAVNFKAMEACKLGIGRYPDFEYNGLGGKGSGLAVIEEDNDSQYKVVFDLETLYVPPLTSATTRFLGLPLPPLLKIEIVPLLFEGRIDMASGAADLEFTANFIFSVGGVYRAPALLVKTVLTTEESKKMIRSGRGERMGDDGICKLVGVATVDRVDDLFMNSFLFLPTECLACLNAQLTFQSL